MHYSNWTLHTFVKKIPAIAFILIIAFMLLKLSLFWYLQKSKKFAFLLVNSEWWIFMKTRKVKIKKADRTIDKTMDGWRDECMDMDIFCCLLSKILARCQSRINTIKTSISFHRQLNLHYWKIIFPLQLNHVQ